MWPFIVGHVFYTNVYAHHTNIFTLPGCHSLGNAAGRDYLLTPRLLPCIPFGVARLGGCRHRAVWNGRRKILDDHSPAAHSVAYPRAHFELESARASKADIGQLHRLCGGNRHHAALFSSGTDGI